MAGALAGGMGFKVRARNCVLVGMCRAQEKATHQKGTYTHITGFAWV